MEFGLFLNGYLPGPAAHHPPSEHEMLQREMQYAVHADAYNWKYAWFGEHHALTEYSHMSAPECVIPYVAAKTERIHLGSAIMNLSPPVNQPTRNAERVAMLDHVTQGRYEWGTGRGAGEHEMQTFDLHTSETKEMWNEVAPEILRMFEQRDYSFEGEFFRVPSPHNILPKPYGTGHPPIWVGCGNPGTFTQAGELGIGAIAFNFEPIYNLKGRIDAYKEGIANCTEPIGQFMNDNVMMTNAVVCVADCEACPRDRHVAGSRLPQHHGQHVPLDHAEAEARRHLARRPSTIPDEATLDFLIEEGYLLCGNPDEVNEQIEQVPGGRLRPAGVRHPQRGLRARGGAGDDRAVRHQGHPQLRHRPRAPHHGYRRTAQRKYPDFAEPMPEELQVEVIPTERTDPPRGAEHRHHRARHPGPAAG